MKNKMFIFKNKKSTTPDLNLNHNKGFVILFAVILTSIILSVSLATMEVSLKEINLGTSSKNTGDAFFAADSGLECALFYDIKGVATLNEDENVNPFGYTGTEPLNLNCAGKSFVLSSGYSATGPWTFILNNLNSNTPSSTLEKSCVEVTVTKTSSPDETQIISKGYNLGNNFCASTNPNRIQREIQIVYSTN